MEEVGIDIKEYKLFDADSVTFGWPYKDLLINGHHVGIFYRVLEYSGAIKNEVEIDEKNDDSLGNEFYEISKLNKEQLSYIAIMELEKLGYNIK